MTGIGPREAVYRCAAVVILADGAVGTLERGWLDHLAAAFELDDERKTTLETEVFG